MGSDKNSTRLSRKIGSQSFLKHSKARNGRNTFTFLLVIHYYFNSQNMQRHNNNNNKTIGQ